MAKQKNATKTSEVETWFDQLDHPQKETMLAVRNAILRADPRISECIKWSTPTFVFEGDLASLQPRAKQFASLLFHRGAEIPGNHPDLMGSARLVRTMQFDSPGDVRAKATALKAIVKAWCEWRASRV